MIILVAEDDAAIFDIVKIILEGEGYKVLHALKESEVLHLAEKESPSIIFLDISLGASDGGEITKKLKSNDSTKAIPVIIMSANHETKEIAQKSGADDFLLKPFDIESLTQIVHQFVN